MAIIRCLITFCNYKTRRLESLVDILLYVHRYLGALNCVFSIVTLTDSLINQEQ